MCFLLFKTLKVGIFLLIDGIAIILYIKSVIWNVCLKGLVKRLFCSIVRVGIRNSWIFPKFVKLDPDAVANLLEVFKDVIFACKVCILFKVGMFIKFDSGPESIEKSISRSDG